MPIRFILHIPRRTLIVLAYLLLAGGLVFFALTRTEVGRDGLRAEIERQFAQRYAGRLQIGRLTGNLVNDLYARDVRLYDAEGRLVLSADSVFARPRWRDALRRQISIGRLALFRPSLDLIRGPDGTWNLSAALRPLAPTPGQGAPWSFTSTDVTVADGRVTTHNLGAAPQAVTDGWVFNYADAVMDDVDAQATVEWRPALKLVDVRRFSAALPGQDLDVAALQGQLVLEGARLAVNRLILEAGRTRLQLSAALDDLDVLAADPAAAVLDLDLAESRLDHRQLRRLLPFLPLADQMTAEARVQGPLAGLVVETLHLARGRTRVHAEGTVLGLPDSLDLDVACVACQVDGRDLQALLPGVDFGPLPKLGTVEAHLQLTGAGHLGEGNAAPHGRLGLSLGSRAGSLEGTVSVNYRADTLHYTADLDARAVDLAPLLSDPGLGSRLSGRLRLDGGGTTLLGADARAVLTLGPSYLAGRRIDTLSADVTARQGRFDGNLYARPQRGVVTAGGSLDLRPEQPAYRLALTAGGLDLGPLLLHDSLATALNGTAVWEGSGTRWNTLSGRVRLALDSSSVRVGAAARTIPPQQARLTLARHEDMRRLTLAGDAASLEVETDLGADGLVALGRRWGTAFAQAVARVTDKPYLPGGPGTPPPSSADAGTLDDPSPGSPVGGDDAALPSGTHRLVATLRVHQGGLLSAILPHLPLLETDLEAHLDLTTDDALLRLTADVTADTFRLGDVRTGRITAALRAGADLAAPLETSFTADLVATGDALQPGGPVYREARSVLTYRDGHASLSLDTQAEGSTGTAHLAAVLDLLPDRNRLVLTDLSAEVAGFTWETAGRQAIDFYADAVVVPGLFVESRPTQHAGVQRLGLRGTWSAVPTDTLILAVDQVDLRRLSETAGLAPALGGILNGRLALTGATRSPELTGTLGVADLSYDDRLLGRLQLESAYVPGTPDVALDLRLRPLPSDDAQDATTAANSLHLHGTFRLPRRFDDTTADPGALDLRLDAAHADAFFMEYIFPGLIHGVEGVFSGTGAIRGTLRHPAFEADLRLRDGRFYVPDYGLRYAAEGRVTVDDAGIHLDTITLTDPTGGTAQAGGSILFNAYRYFSFDLHGRLDELQIINVTTPGDLAFYGRIWASGTATLTGPLYNATLRSSDVVAASRSEVFIPLTESGTATDAGFVVFADSSGRLPDLQRLVRRSNVLADRPAGERTFVDGLEMDLNIFAPQGSTVHLVIDPLLGDVINAVGSGRIQLQRQEGEFFTYGTLAVDAGDYLFTAGEVFVRRFLIDQGTITWDGNPTDAALDIEAAYRTRASRAGLDLAGASQTLIPVVVELHITGRVATPLVDLRLAIDRNDRNAIDDYQGLETYLNQTERSAQYATSVLLTNSFLLTTDLSSGDAQLATTRNQLAFNSLSQLIASQLNRYVSEALPGVDLNLGVQGESTQDLDITYGLALRLLDERLIIRGQGVYYQDEAQRRAQQGLQGEFVVEVRLNPRVSVEVFHRREGDVLTEEALTRTTGAGLSYQTQFTTWRLLFHRLFGWLLPQPPAPPAPDDALPAGDDVASER